MKKIFISTFLFIFCAGLNLYSVPTDFPGEGWKLCKDKDGIAIYSRKIENYTADEVMVIAIINAKIETIMALMRAFSDFVKWAPNCTESRVIRKINDDHFFAYRYNNAPWPINDRDAVSEFKIDFDSKNGKFTIDIRGIREPLVSAREGCVRLTKLSSQWDIIYIDRDKTKIIVKVKAEDSGKIPAFVLNLASKGMFYDMVQGMRGIINEKKYIQAGEKSRDRKKIEAFLSRR